MKFMEEMFAHHFPGDWCCAARRDAAFTTTRYQFGVRKPRMALLLRLVGIFVCHNRDGFGFPKMVSKKTYAKTEYSGLPWNESKYMGEKNTSLKGVGTSVQITSVQRCLRRTCAKHEAWRCSATVRPWFSSAASGQRKDGSASGFGISSWTWGLALLHGTSGRRSLWCLVRSMQEFKGKKSERHVYSGCLVM